MKPVHSQHPRIHLTSQDVERLKAAAKTTHAFYYGKLIEAAGEAVAQKLPDSFGGSVDNRYFGDVLPVTSMAYLLTGDARYASFGREVLKRLVATQKWGDDLDLVTGHFLSGAAIAYDWLYDALPAGERKAVADKMAHHAAILYDWASEERIWWHDFFLHNWNHVITGGLGYAAAALSGENPHADAWSDYVEGMFAKVEKALPEDGSYQEGFAYMTYGWECMVRYFDLAKQLYGRDHFGAPWFRNAPYLSLYFSTPRLRWHDNCMMFGDGPRHFEWHGPVHLFNRSISEYKDAVLAGFVRRMTDAGVGLTRTGSWLNMIWFDPSVAPAPHDKLPTARIFPNLDVVSMRSGWGPDAVMVGFKCTNNAGKKAVKEYWGRDLGSGHAHPDAGSFQVYAFGEWLAVDSGYTQYKETKDHNTILVNGVQQLGGERIWFDVMECFSNGAFPEITDSRFTGEFDYVRGDVTTIYRPQADLTKFIRHVVFIKPSGILIVDELAGRDGSRFEWRMQADEEIRRAATDFTVRKNEARLAVSFLAPANLETAVSVNEPYAPTSAGEKKLSLLSGVADGVSETTIVTFLNAYMGAGPDMTATLAGTDAGRVTVALKTASGAKTLTLDTNARTVTLA